MYFFYYIPVGINTALRRFPTMTASYTLICIAVFVVARYFELVVPLDLYHLVYVPFDGGILTAVGAAFLHFGYVHLIGNLVYLTFFGRYVEDRMGPSLFTFVYLSSAGVGNYLQGLFNTHVLGAPFLGIIGASGAVSGLLGAFIVRFLHSKIRVAYWVFMPLQAYTRAGRAEMPAVFAIALWVVIQIVRGLVQTGGAAASVAYITHIGGFLWGMMLAVLFGQFRQGRIDAQRQQGEKYIRKGEPYAAQGAFIRYLTHRPEDADVYAALARAMVLSGNVEGAKKNYARACELMIEQRRRGDAEDLFLEALRGYSEFTMRPDSHLDLAFGLERNLKADIATKAYLNFEGRYPLHEEAPFALLRAAALYGHTLGDPAKADDCYQKLIDKYPDDRWVDFAREQIRRLSFRTAPAR